MTSLLSLALTLELATPFLLVFPILEGGITSVTNDVVPVYFYFKAGLFSESDDSSAFFSSSALAFAASFRSSISRSYLMILALSFSTYKSS
jgi:hypothetical protein